MMTMRGNFVETWAVCVALLVGAGCAAADPEAAVMREGEELGATVFRTYAAGTTYSDTILNQGQDICILQGFTGPMRCASNFCTYAFTGVAGTASPGLNYAQSNGVPGSGPGQSLYCFPRTKFTGTDVNAYSEYLNQKSETGACRTDTGNSYTGDHFIALAGLGSSFSSTGERIWVSQGDTPTALNKWGVGAVDSPCKVDSYYANVMVREGSSPTFVGPNGTGKASIAGEYDFTIGGGRDVDFALAPPNHLCYFTYIAGNIAFTKDGASIAGVSPTGAQHLHMFTAAGSSLRVKARCVPFAQ